MKTKLIIPLAMCVAMLTACNNSSYDNTYEETSAHEEISLEWYMDSTALKSAMNVTGDLGGSSTYTWLEVVDQEVYGRKCSIRCDFNNDGLESVSGYFDTAIDKEGQKETFDALKEGFTVDYGDPDIEETRVNGTGLPCTYVEWYTENTHIMMTAYLEKADDFEVTVYFNPAEYKHLDDDTTSNDSNLSASSSTPSLTVPHGEVLDVNVTGDILVVKAKITPSFSNHSTISQNFFNLEDLIKNQDCSKYNEIQYWAVSDMTDGSESKVISFTAPKSTIDGIKDGSIEAIAYLDEYGYVTDVYILPSLKD